MKAVRSHIVVLIDKLAQSELQSKIGNISIPPKFKFMMYNLQHGPVMSIGADAKEAFPEMEVGDIALFHHSVESNPNHLMEVAHENDKEYEFRAVRVVNDDIDNQVYGIVKDNGNVIAHPEWIFLSPAIKPVKKQLVAELMDGVDSSLYTDEKYLTLQMNRLKQRIDALELTLKNSKDIEKRIQIRNQTNVLRDYREQISRYVNSEKVVLSTALHVNKSVTDRTGIRPGSEVVVTHADGLVSLSLFGNIFAMAMTQYTVGILE